MILNRLKKITIGSLEFDIIWDKTTGGGHFSYRNREIMVGTKLGGDYAFSILMHELKEIIQVEQGTRYERMDEHDNFHFNYTHAEHSDLCSRLAGLLIKFIN